MSSQRQALQGLSAISRQVGVRYDAQGFTPYLARGIVTAAASSTGPFTVAPLIEDDTPSDVTFSPVVTFPSGGVHAVNDQVVLWFRNQGVEPLILEASSGSGVGTLGDAEFFLIGPAQYFTSG